jgi:hypothetical protein
MEMKANMAGYKEPGFAERSALAQRAKQQVLDRLRTKPPVDPVILAERRARAEEREAAAAEARRVRQEERALAEAAAAEARAASAPAPLDEAAAKAARDARYAARKQRKS